MFSPEGFPICADSAVKPEEGIKSFPRWVGSKALATAVQGPVNTCRQATGQQRPGLLACKQAASCGLTACLPWLAPNRSGHTSWSTSGLGWATFFLLGKLRCFDGQAQPLRFLAALAPLLGAVWIGLSRCARCCSRRCAEGDEWPGCRNKASPADPPPAATAALHPCSPRLPPTPSIPGCRIQDNWHHETDVMAGFGLGLSFAFFFYRQLYAGVMSPHAGMLAAAVRPPQPGGRPSSSRLQLLQGEALSLQEESGDDKV